MDDLGDDVLEVDSNVLLHLSTPGDVHPPPLQPTSPLNSLLSDLRLYELQYLKGVLYAVYATGSLA